MEQRIGILSPGDMGHAIGAYLVARGHRVLTTLDGRSAITRERAERAGLEDAGSLDGVIAGTDLVLSILPPAAAPGLARACAEAMQRTRATPLFADCNAVSPAHALEMRDTIESAGGVFIDGGIIGAAPGRGPVPTRLYVSGPSLVPLLALSGEAGDRALDVRPLGPEAGRASALKMVYAALTKGTMTLQTAVLLAAERLGLGAELAGELTASQPAAWSQMQRVPFLPADSGRWVGEMEEIASTFAAAGVPSGFHEAAAEIFRLMAATPFAAETRETVDRNRTLEQTIRELSRTSV